MHDREQKGQCCTSTSVFMSTALLLLPYLQAAQLQRHPITNLPGILVHVVTSYLRTSTHMHVFQKVCKSTANSSQILLSTFAENNFSDRREVASSPPQSTTHLKVKVQHRGPVGLKFLQEA